MLFMGAAEFLTNSYECALLHDTFHKLSQTSSLQQLLATVPLMGIGAKPHCTRTPSQVRHTHMYGSCLLAFTAHKACDL